MLAPAGTGQGPSCSVGADSCGGASLAGAVGFGGRRAEGRRWDRKPGVQTRSSSFLQSEQVHVLNMTVFNHYRVECKRSSVLR